MNRQRRLSWLAALLLGAACASGGDPASRRSGEVAAVAAALARAKAPAPAPVNSLGKPLAFLVADLPEGRRIIAADFAARRALWSQPATVAGRIHVARDAIVFSQADDTLVALDVTTGAPLWERSPASGATLVGYCTDGDGAYAVYLSKTAGGTQGELLGFDARSGKVRFRTQLSARVGGPVARGGLVAVPQRSQFVTLFDGHTGQPLGDILSRDEAAQFVRALPEGLFFGSQGVFLASDDTVIASRKGVGYLKASLPEFVRAVYDYDLYKPAQGRYSAIDRNRLLWRVQVHGQDRGARQPSFAGGLVVVYNFRFLFAVEATTGALRWAYNHPRVDLAGAEHVGRAIAYADVNGRLGALDASSGRTLFSGPLIGGPAGVMKLAGATFDCEGFFAEGDGGTLAMPLIDALKSIVLDPDRRFSDVRVFAIDRLAKLKQPGVSAALLDILASGQDHDVVVQTASDSLVQLQDPDALDVYIRAIKVHTNYATGQRAQRLDLMARALARLGARKAMPELAEHLRLPDTDPSLVRDIADAVIALQAREVVAAFRDYLAQYRADDFFVSRPGALIAAAEVLLKLGGPDDRALLFFVAEETKTVAAVRNAVARMLAETSGATYGGPRAE